MTTGYGQDIWCYGELQPGRYATLTQVVAQALYRRFVTPKGSLIALEEGDEDEANYGFDLAGWIGALGTERAIAALPVIVRAEALKDDRLSDVSVTVELATIASGETELRVGIDGVLGESGESFALTLGVSDAGVSILTEAST